MDDEGKGGEIKKKGRSPLNTRFKLKATRHTDNSSLGTDNSSLGTIEYHDEAKRTKN